MRGTADTAGMPDDSGRRAFFRYIPSIAVRAKGSAVSLPFTTDSMPRHCRLSRVGRPYLTILELSWPRTGWLWVFS